MREFKRIGLLLFAVISGYLLQVIDGAKLIINPAGERQNQPAGIGFGLTCQGEADDTNLFSEMKFFGPKGEIVEGVSSPIEVSKVGNRLLLMFRNPSSEDSGMYNCSGVYDRIDRLNNGVHITFYQDITWEDCPKVQSLVISNDGKIECRVSANPPATITWTKDHQNLPEHYIIESDGVKVSGVTKDDEGLFQVRAMVAQTGRFQNAEIKVEVHVPPEIVDLNDRMEAIEGEEATMNCQATGFPKPIYNWFDPEQRNLSIVEGHIVNQDTGMLTINNVKQENRGRYTCLAKNPAGEAKRSLDLSVIVKPEIREFNNVTTVQNNGATFECKAFGDPLPDLSIRKQGQDRPFDDKDNRISLHKRDTADEAILTLTIEKTIRDDDGLYYCAAENKGAHAERVGHLTIQFAPVMGSTPSTSVKTWNGNPVNLTCIAEAIPNATIVWYYLGQKLQDNDVYTIYGRTERSNLLVRPSGDARGGNDVYGAYKCQAVNEHGTESIDIHLQEARTPTILTDASPVKETATTLTFRFSGPSDDGGLPVHSFFVKYHEESAPYTQAKIDEWNEGSPYVLEQLKPRTAYRFRFAAKNAVGLGEWSDEIRVVMPAESAPEPPKFITPGGNISTYPDRFQIRWIIPLDNGRRIEYFELRYFEVEKKDGMWRRLGESVTRQVQDWENSPSYEMRSLKANSYYKVEVRAFNEIGFSQDATMVFQTAAGSDAEHQSNGYHSGASSSLSTGAIAAIIISLALVAIIVIDLTCYVRYHSGIVFFLRSRVCAKPIVDEKAKEAAFEDEKGGNESNTNGKVKIDVGNLDVSEKGDNFEKKTRTEVDNPAFDKEKEPLKSPEEFGRDNDVEMVTEDTPMIQSPGAKDTKGGDGNTADMKNKSPKGSKSSIAKDSLV